MQTMIDTNRTGDLDTIEHEVEQLLVPLSVPESFTERLRTGLMASAAGQWSLVRARPQHRWGLVLTAIGGVMSALWLVVWIARRERHEATG
jgi:hypothetical protein